MKRVLVIGCPGSGKSTFARKLHMKTGLPLYYLDMLYWNADKTTVTAEEFDEKLDDVLKKEEWIVDGNYSRTMEKRLKRSDTVFFFDIPTETCIEGIKNRVGTARPDMPWLERKVDEELLEFVKGFNKNTTPEIRRCLDKYDGIEKICFTSRNDAEMFLIEMSVN